MKKLLCVLVVLLCVADADARGRRCRGGGCSGGNCGGGWSGGGFQGGYAQQDWRPMPGVDVGEMIVSRDTSTLPGVETGKDGKEILNEALADLNRQRAQRGMRPYIEDPLLTQAAQAAASFRASRGMEGHTGNDFQFVPGGTSAQAAGCAAWPPSMGFGACCCFEGWTYAGAATVIGRDGRAYHHLFVRR